MQDLRVKKESVNIGCYDLQRKQMKAIDHALAIHAGSFRSLLQVMLSFLPSCDANKLV